MKMHARANDLVPILNKSRRKGMLFRRILVKTVLIACVFCLVSAGAADRPLLPTSGGHFSPINPEYQQYLIAKALGLVKTTTAEGYPLGEIPPLVNRPFTRQSPYVRKRDAAPAAYDLRTVGGVTDVRDQGNCGSCWVFGTYSSLESNLKFKYAETRDFSEQHMNKKHGFDIKPCLGGHEWMATAYLTRWTGPWDESKMKYPYAAGDGDMANPVQKHIQNVWFLDARSSSTDNDEIKEAIMAYGALKVSIYWNSAYWNNAHNSFYCTAAGSGTNHAVAIVGWDDAFPAAYFNTTPPGDGAFLIRNSWGSGWGSDGGYFWISYYDTRFARCVGYYDAEAATNYTKNYQYDPLGNVYDYGDEMTDTAYGANIFKAAGKPNNTIKAIGFWALASNTKVEISIYNKVLANNPVSGTQVGTTYTTTVVRAGYATVVLPTPAVVTPGKKFSVVVKFTTPEYYYPVPTEGREAGYSTKAKSKKNQSFVSLDGTTWEDLYFVQIPNPYAPTPAYYRGNVCIKAYAGK
jgi:C1A family cysteine protease